MSELLTDFIASRGLHYGNTVNGHGGRGEEFEFAIAVHGYFVVDEAADGLVAV